MKNKYCIIISYPWSTGIHSPTQPNSCCSSICLLHVNPRSQLLCCL